MLTVVDMTLDEANAYVEAHHRHSLPVVQHKWSLGAVADGQIVGVAIIERPKARKLDDTWTLEVSRVCTTGHPNACSFLYGAAWRSIKSRGYLHAITYVKDSELAASVRAAGWLVEDTTKGAEWDQPSRPRKPAKYEISDRVRYGIQASSYRRGLPKRPTVDVSRVSPDQLELAA